MTVLLAGSFLLAALLPGPPEPAPRRPQEIQLPEPGLPPVPVPAGNPITAEKALLGKALFWDEQLSTSGTVACGTCHVPTAGGADPRTFEDPGSLHPGLDQLFGGADDVGGSRGVIRQLAGGSYAPAAGFGLKPQVTDRRAPSVINAGYASELFWDGRAAGAFQDPLTGQPVLAAGAALEAQSIFPPVSFVEMAHEGEDWSGIAARVQGAEPLRLAFEVPAELAAFVQGRTYPELFSAAFGTSEVTPARIALALATYQRTLISDRSRFDDYLLGDTTALSSQEVTGMEVFFGQGNCAECHTGSLLSDNLYHDVGVRPDSEDLGRGAITGLQEDAGRFRTPSLRNVELRAPFFHNGRHDSLGAVVNFYDDGGDFEADELIVELNMGPSKRLALTAFLRALTDPRVRDGAPPFDRPKLFSESPSFPQAFGAGTAGSGAATPELIAVEPATAEGTALHIGVRQALGGAPALLAIDVAQAPSAGALLGAEVWLAASPALFVCPVSALAGAASAGEGHTTFTLDLSAAGLPVGLSLYLQGFVLDPGAPSGLASTAGTRLTVL